MSARRGFLPSILAAAVLTGALSAPPASAAPAPAWSVSSLAVPTNFKPGDKKHDYFYEVVFTNAGGAATEGSNPIVLTDTLPAGLTVKNVELPLPESESDFGSTACKTEKAGETSTVTCTISEGILGTFEPALLGPSEHRTAVIHVSVPATASGTLTNVADVLGGGAGQVTSESSNPASNEPAQSGISEFRASLSGGDGEPVNQAASHPFEYTTGFAVNTNPAPAGSLARFVPAAGDLKNVEVKLPPGLVGNPNAVTRCTPQQFTTIHQGLKGGRNLFLNECPDSSAVGVVVLRQIEGQLGSIGLGGGPVYNLVPPPGMPAQFGFQAAGAPIYIDAKLRSGGDYGITASLRNTSEAKRISAASVTIWGVPEDPIHNPLRGACAELGGSCPAGGEPRPFLRLPTSCQAPLSTEMEFDTWTDPGAFFGRASAEPALEGCNLPEFSPAFEAQPTSATADSPTGLRVDLHIPQVEQEEDPEGRGEADLRDATVTLPPGLVVNPASAGGLQGCSPAQIGLTSSTGQIPPLFDPGPAACPDASKVGKVEVDTPLIDHPLPGAVYLATQAANPFGSLLAIYIAVDDPQSGVVVKLAGKVTPDPVSGQLTTTFTENPQTPFEDFHLDFFEGARAPLRTPPTCGTHTTTTSLTPWTAPASGAPETPPDSFQITTAPGGGTCPTTPGAEPNAPNFEAGTASPIAGAYSPFILHLARQDGSQELKGLNVTLPPGLSAKLAGVAECSEGQVAQAQARSKPGEGATEQASPSCPASSQLGTVTVGAGAGPAPFYVGGKAYLAGPYKGAPLSMLIVTPAVAGPFDLGSVAVRAALYVDPETAQGTVKSDPIPTILQGIPLDVRSIAVKVDRDQFTLNPTSCEVKAVTGEAISVQGQTAPLTNRFQVGGCASLGFKPKLSLRLKGATKRAGNPALRATLTYPKGAYANIAKASVALPHSEFLDQAHIRTVCTRVQFAADQCPAAAIYGHARAITPLLDQPLEGPVYLRSSSNLLPDLVADLNGQIHVVLHGRTDSFHGGLRNSFEAVPDAPVSKFVLEMQGGKKGLIVNSTDLCAGVHKADAQFTGHNGKRYSAKPAVRAQCGKAKKGKKGKGGKGHHKRR